LDTWVPGKGESTVEALLEAITPWTKIADGLTISGGEPFDQPAALLEMLLGAKRLFDGDVLVYSGYPIEKLDLTPFNGLIDVLMSDPFDRMAPQSLRLRGSDNQRLNFLTDKGKERFSQCSVGPREQAFDVMFDDETGEVFFVGIPRSGDMRRFGELLRNSGHTVATSEDARVFL
jgi:anaerobic ribonucleoside-triphosphate reductase activating protein